MKVLIVTGHYGGPNRQPWLLDDLANEFVDSGHSVDVIVLDPTRGRMLGEQSTSHPNISIYSVGTRKDRKASFDKLLSYIATGFRLHTVGFKWVKNKKYDLCITTTIAAFNWGFPGRIRRCGITLQNLVFLWDFFPIHHIEIGRIRSFWLATLMKFIERYAICQNDVVALMSPANKRFFHAYHPGLKIKTIEIPPWASEKNLAMPVSQVLPLSVIFGGQLAKGRGVDTLLEAAALLQSADVNVKISIAGDGPDRFLLEAYRSNLQLRNVDFVGNLPREDYRSLAGKSHVGIAVTVPGISPPSFPSKIVEYLSLGLPVIVCVEESSDAGDFVLEGKAGFKVPAGDATKLAASIRYCVQLLKSGQINHISNSALRLFETRLSVKQAVKTLESNFRTSVHEQIRDIT